MFSIKSMHVDAFLSAWRPCDLGSRRLIAPLPKTVKWNLQHWKETSEMIEPAGCTAIDGLIHGPCISVKSIDAAIEPDGSVGL
jgi:hypothetical protein